jgi:hypothetical protein
LKYNGEKEVDKVDEKEEEEEEQINKTDNNYLNRQLQQHCQ